MLRTQGRVIHYEYGLIARDPRVMFGTPVVAGTRIPVRVIEGYIASGYSCEQVRKEFPDLSIEQIGAALSFCRKYSKRIAS